MKNTWKKILAVVLSGALIAGCGAGYSVYAAKDDGAETEIKEEVSNLISGITEEQKQADTWQDETVYVIASNKGEVSKTIVSDSLKDNVNGTETVTQGTTEAALPIDVRVTYTLDGAEIEPAQLAGKSGHVTVTYDYTNNEIRKVQVNGSGKEMYVPFAVIAGMLLDSKSFSNVSVEGGRVVGDGSRLVAVGIAFPGMKSNLKIGDIETDHEIEIPESFVVEADVKDFKLSNTYILVTDISLGTGFDADSLESILGDAADEITDAMDKLLDGSEQLRDGIADAKEGTDKLNDAAHTAHDGAKQLSDGAAAALAGSKQLAAGIGTAGDGAKQLDAGIGAVGDGAKQLDTGIAQLGAGLGSLDENSAVLIAGAGQVFDSLLATADSGLAQAGIEVPALTKENYLAVIDGALAALDEKAAGAAAQYQAAAAAGLATPEMAAQIEAGAKALEAGKAKLTELKASLDSYNTFYQGIIMYTAGVSQAAAGAGQLTDGSAALTAGIDQLADGSKALAAGLDQLADGSASLKSGLDTLSAGNAFLADGLGELADGTAALDDGMDKLYDGSVQLSDGIGTLSDELVKKVVEFINEDAADIADTLSAIADISKEYKSINGLGDAEDGAVKFIYKLNEIK